MHQHYFIFLHANNQIYHLTWCIVPFTLHADAWQFIIPSASSISLNMYPSVKFHFTSAFVTFHAPYLIHILLCHHGEAFHQLLLALMVWLLRYLIFDVDASFLCMDVILPSSFKGLYVSAIHDHSTSAFDGFLWNDCIIK